MRNFNSKLMNELGNFTGTFNINIKNETTNIKLEDKLTLIENMIDKFNKEKDL